MLGLGRVTLAHKPALESDPGQAQDGVSGTGGPGSLEWGVGCESRPSRGSVAAHAQRVSICPNASPGDQHATAPWDFQSFRIFLSKGRDP